MKNTDPSEMGFEVRVFDHIKLIKKETHMPNLIDEQVAQIKEIGENVLSFEANNKDETITYLRETYDTLTKLAVNVHSEEDHEDIIEACTESCNNTIALLGDPLNIYPGSSDTEIVQKDIRQMCGIVISMHSIRKAVLQSNTA
jgi:hypothetical protein